jgi:hypothetical protein
MVYFSIANLWDTCSDDDINRFKSFIRINMADSSTWGKFQIACRKEWIPPTMIDIYIVPEGVNPHDRTKFLHFYINESDELFNALSEDE